MKLIPMTVKRAQTLYSRILRDYRKYHYSIKDIALDYQTTPEIIRQILKNKIDNDYWKVPKDEVTVTS